MGGYDMVVEVHAVHSEDVAALWNTLDGYGLLGEDEATAVRLGNRPALVSLGEIYGNDSAEWDAPSAFARELADEAPSAVVRAFIAGDGDRGTTGMLALHVPGHAVYVSECDANGSPIFTRAAVLQGIAREELALLLGVAEFEGLDRAEHTQGPRVIAVKACPGCGELEPCETRCPENILGCDLPVCVSHPECEVAAREEDQAYAVNDAYDRGVLALSR